MAAGVGRPSSQESEGARPEKPAKLASRRRKPQLTMSGSRVYSPGGEKLAIQAQYAHDLVLVGDYMKNVPGRVKQSRRKYAQKAVNHIRPLGPVQMSAFRAPAGGVVVRGINYQGGKYVPVDQKDMKAGYTQWKGLQDQAAKYSRADGSVDTEALLRDLESTKRPKSRPKKPRVVDEPGKPPVQNPPEPNTAGDPRRKYSHIDHGALDPENIGPLSGQNTPVTPRPTPRRAPNREEQIAALRSQGLPVPAKLRTTPGQRASHLTSGEGTYGYFNTQHLEPLATDPDPVVREFIRAVREGDYDSLAVLADYLEEQNHPESTRLSWRDWPDRLYSSALSPEDFAEVFEQQRQENARYWNSPEGQRQLAERHR